MPANSSKAKSKRRPAPKTKAKRARSKPLLAVVPEVRTAKPRTRARPHGLPPAFPRNPALMMLGMMGRLMDAYVEFPARLAQCKSPMDLWLEQARFAQRICSVCQSTAPSGLRG